ncbi:MAG TPA: dihydrolipoamide acetyltransferase family protein [Casimicrobiaceae bacterium]|nr:dihydrolipoamide acetyltransferase family protein [Casimicrobiaceae bacterium]
MTMHVVKVPDIGEGIAEVEVVEWQVAVGDSVIADQVIADVMTDKATVEVPSPVSGRVIALGGNAGEKLAVGSELARIEVDGAGAAVAVRTAAAAPAAAAPIGAAMPSIGMGKALAPSVSPSGGKPLASPSVRRHARELEIDLGRVPGSGPDGRIVHDDLIRYAGGGTAKPEGVRRYAERNDEKAVPVIGLRRQIALRMRDALRIPHFTYVEEIDVTELEALRVRLNDEHGSTRGRLTVLPFLMRAIVLTVPSFPQLNARFDDDKGIVTRYGALHIGVAAQTEGGLMVPVVRHAEARDLWSTAAEVARLAEAARSGKATREELSGSTITITSLGPLGGIVTTPVINPPEVAIVGVNRIVERPVIRSGAIVPRKLMNLSSSFDHRVVDGQHAAEFVQALRGYLECPAMLFVD